METLLEILSESFLFYALQSIALRGHRQYIETQMKDLVWLGHHHLQNDIMVDVVLSSITAEVKEAYCGSKKAMEVLNS